MLYDYYIITNKPKADTFTISSPPRGWARLTRDGEIVPHRDGEVGALTPLAGLPLWSGRPADWARAHWQPDPLPGPAQRASGGARHPALRGRPRHSPHITDPRDRMKKAVFVFIFPGEEACWESFQLFTTSLLFHSHCLSLTSVHCSPPVSSIYNFSSPLETLSSEIDLIKYEVQNLTSIECLEASLFLFQV